MSEEKLKYCSFCGRDSLHCHVMIESESALICDSCIKDCVDLMNDFFEDKKIKGVSDAIR